MAGFKAHLTSGIITGAGIGAAGFFANFLKPTEAIAIAVTGTIGGLLPDLDSDTGKPLALLFQMISILIPVFVYPHFLTFSDGSVPFLICYFTLSYVFINYVICAVIKRITKHRGVMHSIPFAILCGEMAYLFLTGSGKSFACIAGVSIFAGCMVHLVLDELHSITFKFGIIPVVNKAGGSALKFFSSNMISIIFIYICVFILGTQITTEYYDMPYLSGLTKKIMGVLAKAI